LSSNSTYASTTVVVLVRFYELNIIEICEPASHRPEAGELLIPSLTLLFCESFSQDIGILLGRSDGSNTNFPWEELIVEPVVADGNVFRTWCHMW
jgi:hypothetical protein